MMGRIATTMRWRRSTLPRLKFFVTMLILAGMGLYAVYLISTNQWGGIDAGFHIRSGGFDWEFHYSPLLFAKWFAAFLMLAYCLFSGADRIRVKNRLFQNVLFGFVIFFILTEAVAFVQRVSLPDVSLLQILAIVSFGGAYLLSRGVVLERIGDWARNPGKGRWLMFSAGCVTACIGWRLIFGGHALMIDSISQISQARVLLLGDFTLDMPQRVRDVINFPSAMPTVPSYSQFPPGYLIFLAPLIALGIPAHFFNLILAGMNLLLTMGIARRISGDRTALCAGVLLAFSPFFIGLAGSAMNHVPTSFALLVATYCFLPAGPIRSRGHAHALYLLGGIMLAWAATIRPLTAFAHGLTWCVVWVCVFYSKTGANGSSPKFYRPELIRLIMLAAIGLIPPLLFLMYYNSQTTGHPLVLAYQANNPELHRLGFSFAGINAFTPLDALENLAADIISLNFRFFGWLTGSWILLISWWMQTRLSRGERILMGLIASQTLLYGLYSYHHLVLGPRFLFEVLPYWCIFGGMALSALLRGGGRRAGAIAVLVLLLCAGGAGKGIHLNREDFGLGVLRHDRIKQFMSRTLPLTEPTVVVFDHAFIDNFGVYFPHLPGQPDIWFVSERDEGRAREVPELAECRWFHLGLND